MTKTVDAKPIRRLSHVQYVRIIDHFRAMEPRDFESYEAVAKYLSAVIDCEVAGASVQSILTDHPELRDKVKMRHTRARTPAEVDADFDAIKRRLDELERKGREWEERAARLDALMREPWFPHKPTARLFDDAEEAPKSAQAS